MAAADSGLLETILLDEAIPSAPQCDAKDPKHSDNIQSPSSFPTVLPHLLLPPNRPENTRDIANTQPQYVDTGLFSPEASRHSFEVAHRRAKTLESEVLELLSENCDTSTRLHRTGSGYRSGGHTGRKRHSLSNGKTGNVISDTLWTILSRMKRSLQKRDIEYDLLSGSSPLSRTEDSETDGDGLQLSPQQFPQENRSLRLEIARKPRSALKRVSKYSNRPVPDEKTLEKTNPSPQRRIRWDETIVKIDEEHAEVEGKTTDTVHVPDQVGKEDSNASLKKTRSVALAKKHGVMRRLTPTEKEELYKVRPDLMIIPNWAQKYREEMMETSTGTWSIWLVWALALLLVTLVILVISVIQEH
uniref:Uncharacterized protein AlNc14C146G7393 n=1 Tax=Albugo laibachii Nc14 TaxID=890382 RepID=F0WLK6_9STRA|nr:conserved hypothetical protein [Albugo laibachii Nc14]CCA24227.1 conserved hypothetical protein [Albugo laibachii Nc14]|eukprot:CCA24227.1 conserved hypothetical protein [Albugo laibachii Nc14]